MKSALTIAAKFIAIAVMIYVLVKASAVLVLRLTHHESACVCLSKDLP